MLGIDIGTSAIKMAEVARVNHQKELTNYGVAKTREYLATIKDALEAGGAKTLEDQLGEFLKRLLEEAGMKTKEAVFSLPVFSSFSTTISFPATMKEEELLRAVPFEAKSYVPLPLAEVELDWIMLPSRPADMAGSREVFIVAVPKEIVEKYQRIAVSAGIRPIAFEVETFGLARALASKTASALIVDIGTAATSLTVTADGIVRFSHSVEVAGGEFSRVLAQGLRITLERAEEIKKQEGITSSGVRNVLLPFIDQLVSEIGRALGIYERKAAKVETILLSGGSSRLPGIAEYLSAKLGRSACIGQPLAGFRYPKDLEPILPELSSTFAVAVGLALRELT